MPASLGGPPAASSQQGQHGSTERPSKVLLQETLKVCRESFILDSHPAMLFIPACQPLTRFDLPQAGPPYPMIVLPKVGGFWIDPPSVEHNDSSSDAVSSSAASTASSTNEQQLDFKVVWVLQ